MNVRKMSCTAAIASLGLLLGTGAAFAQGGQQQMPPATPPGQQTPPGQNYPGTQNPSAQPGTEPGAQPGTRATTQQWSDKTFVKRAAEGNLTEIKLGELAQQNGQDAAIKDFGKRMVDEHTKANNQLKDAAAKDNITLPTALNKHDQATYDKLSKLSGKQFDRAYARMMVRDHAHDVYQFRQEARKGQDPDVKSFAQQALPTLQQHLKDARQTLHSINGTTQGSTRTGAQ